LKFKLNSKDREKESPSSSTKPLMLASSRSHDENISKIVRHGNKAYSSMRRSVLEANTEQERDSSTTEECDELKSIVSISSRKDEYGQIELFFQYDPKKSKLIIKIIQAKDLFNQPADFTKETLDTFVRIMLLPDRRKRTKRKTKTVKDSVTPNWDEQFEFEMSLAETKTKSIDLVVKNTKSVFSRDKSFMGGCIIQLNLFDNLESGITQWFQLHNQTFCDGILKKLLD